MIGETSWDPGFKRDPTRVYAGDLRAVGIKLPESIPDCAHTRRDSIKIGEPEFKHGERKDDDHVLVGTIPVHFTEAFTWVTFMIKTGAADGS
jgi:hypothetical protein